MRYFLALIYVSLSLQLSAQRFVSSNQQLVTDAVKEAMIIISNDSFLADTVNSGEEKKRFTLGVKLLGGICVSGCTEDFFSSIYSAGEKEVYIEVADTNRTGRLNYEYSSRISILDGVLSWLPTATFNLQGLRPDTTCGEKKGWLVWIKIDKNAKNVIDFNPALIAYKKNLTINNIKNSFIIDEPETDDELLGAIYVVPTVAEVGTLEFRLCGVVCRYNNGWRLYSPFIRFGEVYGF